MRVLKIGPSDWVGGNRDRRELSVCQELGAETLVISKGNPEEKIKKETNAGFALSQRMYWRRATLAQNC